MNSLFWFCCCCYWKLMYFRWSNFNYQNYIWIHALLFIPDLYKFKWLEMWWLMCDHETTKQLREFWITSGSYIFFFLNVKYPPCKRQLVTSWHYYNSILSCFVCVCVCVCVRAQSWATLCDPMDCSPPGSSVYGIFQARILKWVTISYSRGSSHLRNWTCASCICCIGKWILHY